MNKDIRKLLQRVEAEGFVVTRLRRHARVTNPDTGEHTTVALTPSDCRAIRNTVSRLRGIGYHNRNR